MALDFGDRMKFFLLRIMAHSHLRIEDSNLKLHAAPEFYFYWHF